MANVYVGSDYYITEIWEEMITDTEVVPNVTLLGRINVNLQRLPEHAYPEPTTTVIHIGYPHADKFPSGLSSDNYIANVLPLVNTALSSYDAAFDGSATISFDLTNFSKKLG